MAAAAASVGHHGRRIQGVRMSLSPASHPLNVFRPAKVRTIFWLVEPPGGLGSSLAGLATFGFCAVALSVSIIFCDLLGLGRSLSRVASKTLTKCSYFVPITAGRHTAPLTMMILSGVVKIKHAGLGIGAPTKIV